MNSTDRLERIRERYLRDDHSTRLGGLAANLARVHSFASNRGHLQAVEDLIVESEHFIEWLAPSARLEDCGPAPLDGPPPDPLSVESAHRD